MSPLRVLVVEDSRTIREQLVAALASDPGFCVVASVGDGEAAIRAVERDHPDVISLDMVLPGVDGLEVTRHVMAAHATPILVVSASANRGGALHTLDALRAGAVDVFDKRRVGTDPDWIEALKGALRMAARIRVVTRSRPRRSSLPGTAAVALSLLPAGSLEASPRVVALGASTGGPAAIARLLAELPPDLDLPLLVVLHLAPLFAGALVEWLGRQSSLKVRLALDGEPLPPPRAPAPVLLAPPDRHLIVERGRLRLTEDPERHACRPSIDVLFESLALEIGSRTIAGVLTGMGRDGAAGLLALRRAGAQTFAQDEATSAVYGMPREAARLGAVARVLPLDQMGAAVTRWSRGVVERNEA